MNKLEMLVQDRIFPITCFNYGGISSEAEQKQSIQDWIELGFNVPQSGHFGGGGAATTAAVRRLLDACGEAGLKLILSDGRGRFNLLHEQGEKKFAKQLAQAVKDFGDHPALFGFDVGDEPAQAKIPSAIRASAIHKELAPHLSPFLNLGPYSPEGTEWMELRSFGQYLDDYCAIGNPDFLCFDVYWQMLPGEEGINNYYRCLKMFSDSALRNNKPLWITLLCCGHWEYRCPSIDDYRWQINTAVAHGCTGIAWFTPGIGHYQNYREAPIVNGVRTDSFGWLSRACRFFQELHGPLMVTLKLQKVFHVGKAYGGWSETIDSELVKAGQSQGDKFPVIISEFKSPDGEDYIAIVNNSQTVSGQALVTLHGKPKLFRAAGDSEGPAKMYVDDANPNSPVTKIGPWLAPGQMEVYRVETDKPSMAEIISAKTAKEMKPKRAKKKAAKKSKTLRSSQSEGGKAKKK